MSKINELITLFEIANRKLIKDDVGLFMNKVSERTLCGALMIKLSKLIEVTNYKNYYVDVEYNRNKDGKVKTIIDDRMKVININCDLIVHSRGENIVQDNLIAIEMKKSYRDNNEKDKDRERLIALTKDSFNEDIWSYDGKTLPEHVCRYMLGVYYEICYQDGYIKLEYYSKGRVMDRKKIYYIKGLLRNKNMMNGGEYISVKKHENFEKTISYNEIEEIKTIRDSLSENYRDLILRKLKYIGHVPFMCRGIKIDEELIFTTIAVLKHENMLPQNCRNKIKEYTPDGLDRRIKEVMNKNIRTANIISDILEEANVVQVCKILNPKTQNKIKATKLLSEWL